MRIEGIEDYIGDYGNNGGEMDQRLLWEAVRIVSENTGILVEKRIMDCCGKHRGLHISEITGIMVKRYCG